MQAIPRLRAWRRRRARRIALGGIERVARGELKELRRLLIRSGLPCEDVSQAMPVLLHCLVKRQRLIGKYIGPLGLGAYALLVVQILYIVYFEIPNPRAEHINDATLVIILLIGALIFKLSNTRVRHFERTLRYDPKFSEMVAFKYFWVLLLLLGIFTMIISPTYSILVNTTWKDWLVILAQVIVLVLYFFLAGWLLKGGLTWRVPELVLVRALADAFELTAEVGPARWRSISRRSRVARYIDQAGNALEGPIARKFARWAGWSGGAEKPGAPTIQERFLKVSAALRSKIAWLATPRSDTRDFLARALGRELLIAATGDLDRLEYDQWEAAVLPSSGRLTWMRRTLRTLSLVAFAFLPAIILVVLLRQNLLTNAMTVVLAQFSLMWFFVSVNPTGIGSVLSAGKALFQWGKD